MGKKRTRAKQISKGEIGRPMRSRKRHWEEGYHSDRIRNQLNAFLKGKRVMLTVENPNKNVEYANKNSFGTCGVANANKKLTCFHCIFNPTGFYLRFYLQFYLHFQPDICVFICIFNRGVQTYTG